MDIVSACVCVCEINIFRSFFKQLAGINICKAHLSRRHTIKINKKVETRTGPTKCSAFSAFF